MRVYYEEDMDGSHWIDLKKCNISYDLARDISEMEKHDL